MKKVVPVIDEQWLLRFLTNTFYSGFSQTMVVPVVDVEWLFRLLMNSGCSGC